MGDGDLAVGGQCQAGGDAWYDLEGDARVTKGLDLVDAMVMAGDKSVSEEELLRVENAACPTCGSCSGMFTANSMNCLNEAIGLALPGNGTVVATHVERKKLFEKAAKQLIKNTLEFDPRILGRYVNFMNNPDEEYDPLYAFGYGLSY